MLGLLKSDAFRKLGQLTYYESSGKNQKIYLENIGWGAKLLPKFAEEPMDRRLFFDKKYELVVVALRILLVSQFWLNVECI